MIFFSKRYMKGEHAWGPAKCMLLLLLVFCLLSKFVSADEREKRIIRAGLDLFPSLLAADLDITQKQNADGKLLLILLCVDKKKTEAKMAQHLMKIEKIRGIPIQVEISDDISFESYTNHKPAGVFLIQPFEQKIDSIIQFTREHNIIVFSPFEGDVKRGVLGGIMVSDRILPHINMKALQLSGIRLKPFFLRVSERYEK